MTQRPDRSGPTPPAPSPSDLSAASRYVRVLSCGPAVRGFSLIELVMVIAILATMSAIAVPRYANALTNYRVDSAARRIVADLAYAQSQARESSSSRTVSFDTASDSYRLNDVADIDRSSGAYVIDLRGEPYRATLVSAVFDDSSDVADLLDEVVFNGYGLPDSGGTIVVTVGTTSKTIVLDPDTGQAVVQ